MARQKNPTALFDVIHSAKKPPKASPSAAIPTPKWWGKNKTLPKPAASETTENVGKQRSWLTAAKKSGVVLGAAAGPSAPAPSVYAPAVPVAGTPPVSASSAASVVSAPGLEYWPASSGETVDSPISGELDPAKAEYSSHFTSSEEEVQTAVVPVPVDTEPKPRFIDRFKNRTSKAAVADVVAPHGSSVEAPVFETAAAESDSAVETTAAEIKPSRAATRSRDEREAFVRVDSAAGDIRFRVSYAGLVAYAFVFLLALAAAFLVGTRVSSQAMNSDDSMPASTEPAAGSIHSQTNSSGLMAAVGPAAAADNTGADPDPKAQQQAPDSVHPDVLSIPQHPARLVPAASANARAATPLPIKKTRDIGMIYVVVQSYPEQEQAQKACDFVNAAGIPCTLVQGPANWAPSDWYSVVSLQPFNKHDASLPDFERSVRELGVKFTSRAIDQFQPQAYTWRSDSDLSQP
jgi:hypothetical protein